MLVLGARACAWCSCLCLYMCLCLYICGGGKAESDHVESLIRCVGFCKIEDFRCFFIVVYSAELDFRWFFIVVCSNGSVFFSLSLIFGIFSLLFFSAELDFRYLFIVVFSARFDFR